MAALEAIHPWLRVKKEAASKVMTFCLWARAEREARAKARQRVTFRDEDRGE